MTRMKSHLELLDVPNRYYHCS